MTGIEAGVTDLMFDQAKRDSNTVGVDFEVSPVDQLTFVLSYSIAGTRTRTRATACSPRSTARSPAKWNFPMTGIFLLAANDGSYTAKVGYARLNYRF